MHYVMIDYIIFQLQLYFCLISNFAIVCQFVRKGGVVPMLDSTVFTEFLITVFVLTCVYFWV